MINRLLIILALSLIHPLVCLSQYTNITQVIEDSIYSEVLKEHRRLTVSLPNGYNSSDKTYPVLYVLDGNETSLLESLLISRKLRTDLIIIAIPNTDRDRDMMPLSTPSYQVKNPGAEYFLSFLETDVIPHIEKSFRSNGQKTIMGKSLSGLFIMYAFLKKPELFNNYIGNSAGWFRDMDPFFFELMENAFKNKDQFLGRKLFVANSLNDTYDPKGEVHQAILLFTQKMEKELKDIVNFRYKTYEEYGHVPYPGFYDGLNFILH